MSNKPYVDSRYPLSELTGRIIAAAKEVYGALGPGFEEVIYQRALAKELPAHSLEFEREVQMDVTYKGERVGHKRVDFFIGDHSGEVLLEIKAKKGLEPVDFVQTLSYLRASEHKIGLLINFGGQQLEIRRVAN